MINDEIKKELHEYFDMGMIATHGYNEADVIHFAEYMMRVSRDVGFWGRTCARQDQEMKKFKKVIAKLGPWASAAQEDPKCCQKLKDIFQEVMELDHLPRDFNLPEEGDDHEE